MSTTVNANCFHAERYLLRKHAARLCAMSRLHDSSLEKRGGEEREKRRRKRSRGEGRGIWELICNLHFVSQDSATAPVMPSPVWNFANWIICTQTIEYSLIMHFSRCGGGLTSPPVFQFDNFRHILASGVVFCFLSCFWDFQSAQLLCANMFERASSLE